MKNKILTKIQKERSKLLDEIQLHEPDIYQNLPILLSDEENKLISRIANDLQSFFAWLVKTDQFGPEGIPTIHEFLFEWDQFGGGGIAWSTAIHNDGGCYHDPYLLEVQEISDFVIDNWDGLKSWRELTLAAVVGEAIELAVKKKEFLALPLYKKMFFRIGVHDGFDKKVYSFN